MNILKYCTLFKTLYFIDILRKPKIFISISLKLRYVRFLFKSFSWPFIFSQPFGLLWENLVVFFENKERPSLLLWVFYKRTFCSSMKRPEGLLWEDLLAFCEKALYEKTLWCARPCGLLRKDLVIFCGMVFC